MYAVRYQKELVHAHITQPTERSIQETYICSQNRKGEDNTSSLVMFRSTEVFPAFDKVRSQFSHRIKQSNQHLGKGFEDEREIKSNAARIRR